VRTIRKLSQSACWPSVLITLMAVADYFVLLCCRPAAFTQTQQVCSTVGDTGTGSRNRCWFPEPVLVSGTRTGSRAVAQPSNSWLLHGNPCVCLIPAREHVLVITLLTSTGSRVLASALQLSNVGLSIISKNHSKNLARWIEAT